MSRDDVEEILFDIFPRKVSTEAESADEIRPQPAEVLDQRLQIQLDHVSTVKAATQSLLRHGKR